MGTTREGSFTPGVSFTCVCVSDSCSVRRAAHSWRPLLNLAFGDPSLFHVSWGLLWIRRKPCKPFCRCLFIPASLFSRRKWNLLGGALGLLGFCWGRRGGVCPWREGNASWCPGVLPRSSSPAGRMTCRSATSRGSAQLLTAATPLTARAPRAIRQRTTGSSSGEVPPLLCWAAEAGLQEKHLAALWRGAYQVQCGPREVACSGGQRASQKVMAREK